MTTLLRKKVNVTTQLKDFDDETGTIKALVNTMGVIDADGDRIVSGAFDKSLAEIDGSRIAVLWGHDQSQVVGKVIDGQEIRLPEPEGATALYLEMLMNLKTQRGRDAYEDVKFGAVTQWSVGFNVPEGAVEIVTDPDGLKVANINELELVEVSAVLRGASPGTTTISVKAETDEKIELPGYPDKYTTIAEAEARAESLGCSGYHEMQGESGRTYYMPCSNHEIYESIEHGTPSGNTYSADLEAASNEAHIEHSAATAQRIKQAVAARIARVRIKWLNKTKGDK